MKKIWGIFSTVVTVLALGLLLLGALPIPIFEDNGVTLILPTNASQEDAVGALAQVIGSPAATLDTPNARRYLFKDGTSVECLLKPPAFQPMYEIVALKTVVLRLFSSETPPEEAQKMQYELTAQGHSCQVIEQPDPAFPPGDIVIVLSDAYQTGSHGFGVLIRKHALRMGGPRPVPFR